MKAILLIELDDQWLERTNLTLEKMFADVTIYEKESLENQCDYSQRIYRCWCPLKPMPKKLLILDHYQDNKLLNSEEVAYAKGRNNCLDEILGKE